MLRPLPSGPNPSCPAPPPPPTPPLVPQLLRGETLAPASPVSQLEERLTALFKTAVFPPMFSFIYSFYSTDDARVDNQFCLYILRHLIYFILGRGLTSGQKVYYLCISKMANLDPTFETFRPIVASNCVSPLVMETSGTGSCELRVHSSLSDKPVSTKRIAC